ncbi:MAG: YfbM family protein [Planctomycetota bacterium]|jgi:hypothetical protein
MGMICVLQAISDENAARILADPPLVWRVLAPDDPEAYLHEREAQRSSLKPGLLSRILGRGSTAAPNAPGPLPELSVAPGEDGEWDLDKAWHGIHWLFTGTTWDGEPPLDLIVRGGTDVGTVDVGYGPARVVSSEEAARAAKALDALSDEELRSRYDGAAMTADDIYPEIWDRDPRDDDALGYLMENVGELRDALAHCVKHGLGLLITIQ